MKRKTPVKSSICRKKWAHKMLSGINPAGEIGELLFSGELPWWEFVGRSVTKDERRALTRAFNELIQM